MFLRDFTKKILFGIMSLGILFLTHYSIEPASSKGVVYSGLGNATDLALSFTVANMIKQSTPGRYLVIPPDVLQDDELKIAEKYLYGVIAQLCNLKGYCWSSNGYLAEQLNVEERSIRRYLDRLETFGYIKILRDSGNLRHIYLTENNKFEGLLQGGQFRDTKIRNQNRADNFVVQGGQIRDHNTNTNISSSKSSSSSKNSDSEKQIADKAAQSELSDSEKRKLRRARKTYYPDKFTVEDSTISGLKEKHQFLTDKDIEKCKKDFHDYHTEDDGQTKKHINWQLTFTKWVGRSIEYGKIGKGKTNEVQQRVVPSKQKCRDCKPDEPCFLHDPNGKFSKSKNKDRYKRNT